MSTATIETPVRRVRAVPPPVVKERMAAELSQRSWARQQLDKILALPKQIWAWAVSTLHLDTAWSWVQDVTGWAADKVSAAMGWLGRQGITGIGLLTLTTEAGWKFLDFTVGNLFRFVGKIFGWGYDLLQSGLHKLGKPGVWMADRLEDGRMKMMDAIHWVGAQWTKYVAPYTHFNGTPMRVGRLAGFLMLATRLIALTPFTPLRWVMIGATALFGIYDGIDVALGFAERRGWVEPGTSTATAPKVITGTVVDQAEPPRAARRHEDQMPTAPVAPTTGPPQKTAAAAGGKRRR